MAPHLGAPSGAAVPGNIVVDFIEPFSGPLNLVASANRAVRARRGAFQSSLLSCRGVGEQRDTERSASTRGDILRAF